MSWILVSDGTGHEMCLNLKKDKRVRWRKNFTLSIPSLNENDLPAFYRLVDGRSLENVTEEVLQDELKNLDWKAEIDDNKTNADIQ